MRNIVTLIFLLGVLLFVEQCYAQTACSYSYRKRITFNPAMVSGPADLTNFPVLINITSDNDLRTTANSGHVQNTNGFDIVFTADDGITLLNFQLERYTATTGQLTAWVKIPSLSTSINTNIYMYYGNSAISTNQSTTSVWANYHGVWHLEASSFLDNGPNNYTLTNNSTTNQSPAFINDGRANSGTQWLEVANTFPNINTNFSMSAWIYTTDNTRAGQRIFCDDVSNSGGYAFSIGDNGTGALRFFSRSSSPISLDSPNNTIANNTWYYVTAVADITNLVKRIFVNGVQVASSAFTGWGTDAGNSSVAGETAAGETGNRLSGRIDEVRVASTALSADWILTEYNNQNSPSTFYSISAEPNVFTGASSSNWNTAGNWSSGSVPTASTDVILTGVSNQPNLNTDINMASVWILPSTTFNINNNRDLGILYDITNCGTMTGSNGNSIVEMLSTSAYAQTQYLSGSGTYSLRDLTINNTFSTNPRVVLGKDVDLANDLVLTSGIVSTTSTNILALGTGATATSGSSASFVSGPMSKAGTAAFVFPVGKGASWRRLGISAPTSSSVFRAEYFNSAHSSSTANTPLDNVSTVEYWQLDRLSGTGNASLTLYWESASASGINNCPDLTIARYNGTSWDERVASTIGGSSCSGTGSGAITTTAVVTAFSPFTFGSKSTSLNPLPVDLIEFKARCESDRIILDWSTAMEKENRYFSVEKSYNGKNWVEIAQVEAAKKQSYPLRYTSSDLVVPDSVPYYRLSQTDWNGTRKIFDIVSVDCQPSENLMQAYPNPASQELNIRLNLSNAYGKGVIVLMDNLGRECTSQTVDLAKGNSLITLSINQVPGSYVLVLRSAQLVIAPKHILVE